MVKCRSYIYQCMCKILLNFVYSVLRYWGKIHFGHESRAITVVSEWNYPTCNSIPLLSDTNVYAMHMQNFIEICLFILKILTKKCILDMNQGPLLLFLNEIIPLAIPYHSSPIPMSMQCICKILLKFVYSFLRYWPKNAFWTWIKGHNYVVSEWNYPTCNPIPLLFDTNVYAKFEENR